MFRMLGIEQQAAALLVSISVLIAIVTTALYVLVVIGYWRVFEKGGERGWKAIIPVYNIYILFKMVWDTKAFWATLIVSLAVSLVMGFLQDLPVLYGIIDIAFAVFVLVVDIMLMARLSEAFGKSTGFTVGLVLLNTIFMLILGFGSAKFNDPQRSRTQQKIANQQ